MTHDDESNKTPMTSCQNSTGSACSTGHDTFASYPFPKSLTTDIKRGHYLLLSKSGKTETVEASNAKDALGKAKLPDITKIQYLGFSNKVIIDSSDFIKTPDAPAAPEEVAPESTEKEESPKGE